MLKHLGTKTINTDRLILRRFEISEAIIAMHNTENIASGKVMIKNNMKYEGTLRQAVKLNDSFYDLKVYSILKSE